MTKSSYRSRNNNQEITSSGVSHQHNTKRKRPTISEHLIKNPTSSSAVNESSPHAPANNDILNRFGGRQRRPIRIHTIGRSFTTMLDTVAPQQQQPAADDSQASNNNDTSTSSSSSAAVAPVQQQQTQMNESLYSFARSWFMANLESSRFGQQDAAVVVGDDVASAAASELQTPKRRAVKATSNGHWAPSEQETSRNNAAAAAQKENGMEMDSAAAENVTSRDPSHEDDARMIDEAEDSSNPNQKPPHLSTPPSGESTTAVDFTASSVAAEATPFLQTTPADLISTEISKHLRNQFINLKYELPQPTDGKQALEQICSNQRRRSKIEKLRNQLVHEMRERKEVRCKIARVRFEQARICLCKRLILFDQLHMMEQQQLQQQYHELQPNPEQVKMMDDTGAEFNVPKHAEQQDGENISTTAGLNDGETEANSNEVQKQQAGKVSETNTNDAAASS